MLISMTSKVLVVLAILKDLEIILEDLMMILIHLNNLNNFSKILVWEMKSLDSFSIEEKIRKIQINQKKMDLDKEDLALIMMTTFLVEDFLEDHFKDNFLQVLVAEMDLEVV